MGGDYAKSPGDVEIVGSHVEVNYHKPPLSHLSGCANYRCVLHYAKEREISFCYALGQYRISATLIFKIFSHGLSFSRI